MAITVNLPDTDRMNVWSIDDMYLGDGSDSSKKKWRPNVGDAVIDWTVGTYKVLSVSDENIPSLELVISFNQESQINKSSTSLITAMSKYQPSLSQRLYIDTSVTPYNCVVDNAFQIYDDQPIKMKFFDGTNTTETGVVISEVYNSSGDLTSDFVALKSLTDSNGTIKVPEAFHTTTPLVSGNIVTGVAYTSDGTIFREQAFLITNTSAVMPVDATTVYITAVTLKGNIVSSDADFTLENKIGDVVDSSVLKGVIHYSDGSTKVVGIDGSKMVLQGIDNFNTSYVGYPAQVTLSYYPSDSEPYINGGSGTARVVSQVYKLANLASVNAYNLKVFIAPYWDSTNTKYTYKYWLVNALGDLFQDVTSLISATLAESSSAVSGTNFGNKQAVRLALDMTQISPTAYPNYTHTQSLDLTIDNPDSVSGQTWLIDYIGDGLNIFGTDVWASCTPDGDKINFATGMGLLETQQEDWLKKLYYPVDPIFDNTTSDTAVAPTGFRYRIGNTVSDIIELSAWNTTVDVTAGTFAEENTVTLEWILHNDDGDYVKAVTPMYVKADLSA